MAIQIDPNTGERITDAPQIDPQTGERIASSDNSASPSMLQALGQGAKDLGAGLLKGGLHTISSADDFATKHLPAWMTTPIGQTATPENSAKATAYAKDLSTPTNTMQKIGSGVEQAGEFLIPGAAEDAAAKMIAKGAPKLATAGRYGLKALGSGIVNKAQGGSFTTGAAAGAAGEGIGQGLKALAPKLAETALGVRAADRAYGRTPGQSILSETTGIKPGDIANQAKSRISDLSSELEDNAANSHLPGAYASVVPAREAASGSLGTAISQNNPAQMKELGSLSNQLTHPLDASGKPITEDLNPSFSKDSTARRFTPLKTIPDMVPPSELLSLKRGVGALKNSWNPATVSDLANSTIGRAYGAMDGELDRTVPGAKELNDRISTLMPVSDRAGAADLNAGTVQRMAARMKTHTGALAAPLAGASAGAATHGPLGALIGGAAGLIGQEVVASPTVQMGVARAANSPLLRKGLIPLRGLTLQGDR